MVERIPNNNMRHILAIIALSIAPSLSAGGVSSIVSSTDSVPNIVDALKNTGKVEIEQPQGLLKRLEFNTEQHVESNTPATSARTRAGYRVEIFSDNNVRTAKARAAAKRAQIMNRFPQYRVYVTFEAPFWRVRLGDFSNRGAADAAMAEVRRAIPSLGADLRVVRCTINNR